MGELCAPPTAVGGAAWHKHRSRIASGVSYSYSMKTAHSVLGRRSTAPVLPGTCEADIHTREMVPSLCQIHSLQWRHDDMTSQFASANWSGASTITQSEVSSDDAVPQPGSLTFFRFFLWWPNQNADADVVPPYIFVSCRSCGLVDAVSASAGSGAGPREPSTLWWKLKQKLASAIYLFHVNVPDLGTARDVWPMLRWPRPAV